MDIEHNRESNNTQKIILEDEDDKAAETIEEVATESSNLAMVGLEDSLVAGDDKTSADYYFDSYSYVGVHEDMLKDVNRTKTFQNLIYRNSNLFKDKVILDAGAGTGMFSLFCAKVGAKHVYAVECSSFADVAQEIVKQNGFSDVITVLKGKIEEIKLPVAQVDVIISEWMGHFLVYENMLNAVLYARDKWLVKDGLLFPDKASLHMAAIEDTNYKKYRMDFWNNVYGFDMSCIRKQSIMEPLVDSVEQKQIVTNCQLLKTMDISKMDTFDSSFAAPFKLVAERDDYIHALVAYLDVSFTKCHNLMGYSTAPKSHATPRKQTILYLEDVVSICQGETLMGTLSVMPNKNPRDVYIMLDYSVDGKHFQARRTQYYRMSPSWIWTNTC